MRLPLLPPELHTTERPSSTAQWTTLGRALELERPEGERIVTDAFAPAFLSGTSRRVLVSLRATGPLTRRAESTQLAAIAASALCRHRFIDEHLLEALPDLDQVLLLGAGYDSRAYRFRRSIDRRPVFEVDLPPLSRRKAGIVAENSDLFGPTTSTRVEIDFRRQSLRERLAEAGFRAGAPTFVVWEGVSMYLSSGAVRKTVGDLAAVCGRGSALAMDCWRHVGGISPYDTLRRVGERAIRLVGEPLTFSTTTDRIRHLLAGVGFDVTDLATAATMTRRYATAGRRCDEGMFVLCARLG